MGSGKPPSPHHPPGNVPICHGARAEGGKMDDPLGLLTWPPKVGPEGGHVSAI